MGYPDAVCQGSGRMGLKISCGKKVPQIDHRIDQDFTDSSLNIAQAAPSEFRASVFVSMPVLQTTHCLANTSVID
jgi:hypothetical protein